MDNFSEPTLLGNRQPARLPPASPRLWMTGGTLLGAGLGGLFDGIVFHQLLQWHHLLDTADAPRGAVTSRLILLADGVFQAGTVLVALLGLALVWQGTRRAHPGWRTAPFVGALLSGWGLFNLIEGVVNHQLLGVHHVRPGPHELIYDLGYLAWGAALLLLGAALRRQRRDA